MRFEWDGHKKAQNLRKDDVRFETAQFAFDDPDAISQRDIGFDDEERWITVGAIGPGFDSSRCSHVLRGPQGRSSSHHLSPCR
jgi:uncharacterized DUF497 family protein